MEGCKQSVEDSREGTPYVDSSRWLSWYSSWNVRLPVRAYCWVNISHKTKKTLFVVTLVFSSVLWIVVTISVALLYYFVFKQMIFNTL